MKPDYSPAVKRWMAKGGKVCGYSDGGFISEVDEQPRQEPGVSIGVQQSDVGERFSKMAYGGYAKAPNQKDSEEIDYDEDSDEEDDYKFAKGGMVGHPIIALVKAIRSRGK